MKDEPSINEKSNIQKTVQQLIFSNSNAVVNASFDEDQQRIRTGNLNIINTNHHLLDQNITTSNMMGSHARPVRTNALIRVNDQS